MLRMKGQRFLVLLLLRLVVMAVVVAGVDRSEVYDDVLPLDAL